mmetsp:Transcript_22523/g.36030  ORF Transcript_22523/g.36030 Transcript_22523/m.36030 type:complete len:108 (+) Transcript_22523:65-388(+)
MQRNHPQQHFDQEKRAKQEEEKKYSKQTKQGKNDEHKIPYQHTQKKNKASKKTESATKIQTQSQILDANINQTQFYINNIIWRSHAQCLITTGMHIHCCPSSASRLC